MIIENQFTNLSGKTVIVTGCNTGIGKETAMQLAKRGAKVIMACRDKERTEPARQEIISATHNQQVIFMQLDLSSLNSVRSFAAQFNDGEDRLDILVNNAGVFTTDRRETAEGHEMMFGVNHLGHFLLTNLLLDKLKSSKPSRVVIVSSLAHERNPVNLDDVDCIKSFNSMKMYGKSKSANLLFATHLANLLKDSGVTVYALHPGIIKTELGRDSKISESSVFWCLMRCFACCICDPLKTTEQGAATTLYCCLEPSIADHSGRYYSDAKEKAAKSHAVNPESALRLWNLSQEMCGIR